MVVPREAGQAVYMPAVAQELIEEMKRSRAFIERTSVFADDHERGHVLAVYEEGIATFQKLLDERGRGAGKAEPRGE